MTSTFYNQINNQIKDLKSEGLYKRERAITSAQNAAVSTSTDEEDLNFCANNYLGLANHPSLIETAKKGLFETILDANDAIISDSLNYASITDGVRLCKAKRLPLCK